MINQYREAERYLSLQAKMKAIPKEYPSESGREDLTRLQEDMKQTCNMLFSGTRKPKGMMRAFTVLARWYLYEENKKVEEIGDCLWNWYSAVMRLVYLVNARNEAEYKNLMTELETDKKQIVNNEITDNLDKIKTYQAICRAHNDGPLRRDDPKIPAKILDYWHSEELTDSEMALCLLYHYYGSNACLQKQDIALWDSYGLNQNYLFGNSGKKVSDNIWLSERSFFNQKAYSIHISEHILPCTEWEDNEQNAFHFDEWPENIEEREKKISVRLKDLAVISASLEAYVDNGISKICKKQSNPIECTLKKLFEKHKNKDGSYNKAGMSHLCVWICILLSWNTDLERQQNVERINWGFLQTIHQGTEYKWSADSVRQWAAEHSAELAAGVFAASDFAESDLILHCIYDKSTDRYTFKITS